MNKSAVLLALGQLREVAQDAELWRTLKPAEWNRLCASMDAATDSELAIQAYRRARPTSQVGLRYLRVYGLLQAMFVQQDAAVHAGKAAGLALALPEALEHIRNIRNCAVGHPSEKRGRKGTAPVSYGIVQATLRHGSFEYYPFHSELRLESHHVQLAPLLRTQEREISRLFKVIIGKVKVAAG